MSSPTVALVLFFASAALMLVVGGSMQAADAQYGIIGSEFVAMLAPALAVAWMMRRAPDRPDPLPFSRVGFGPKAYTWVIVSSILLGLAANVSTGTLAHLVPGWHELAEAYEAMFQSLMFPDDSVRAAVAIVAVVAVAPLCEETLFRGVMLPLLNDNADGVARVIIINGALFALIHMNPLSFLALLAIGAFFAQIALLSGSIWPSIIGHATLNGVNGVIVPRLLENSEWANEPSLAVYAISTAVLVPLTAACWYAGWRRLRDGGLAHA